MNYYELKAVDVDDDNDDENYFFNNQVQSALQMGNIRKPSWDIKHLKNMKHKNLNDSRENDFEGFDEIFD